MTRILGIDPSTKTGICMLTLGAKLSGNVQMQYETRLVTNKMDSKTVTNHMARITDLQGKIQGLIEHYKPDLAVVENYSYSSKFISFVAVEINAIIRWELYKQGVPYILIPPTSLKKFVTGKGNSAKDLLRLEAYKRWGVEAKTDDEIDAYGLAMMGAAFKGYDLEMPEVNMTALKKDICLVKS